MYTGYTMIVYNVIVIRTDYITILELKNCVSKLCTGDAMILCDKKVVCIGFTTILHDESTCLL